MGSCGCRAVVCIDIFEIRAAREDVKSFYDTVGHVVEEPGDNPEPEADD